MCLCCSLWTLKTELTNSACPSQLSHFNVTLTQNKQRSSVFILMRCTLLRFVSYVGYLWLAPHSQWSCIPPERSQCSAALSSRSLIPGSTWLYKWGPCCYQGYQFVWNLRPVRVRTVILSSRWLCFTLLLLYFTHAFHFCAFISFRSQWAENHSRGTKGGKRDERRRRRRESTMIHIKTVDVRVGNEMDVGTKHRGIDETADRGERDSRLRRC